MIIQKYLLLILVIALVIAAGLLGGAYYSTTLPWLLLHTTNISLAIVSYLSLQMHRKAIASTSQLAFMNKTLFVMGLRMLVVLGIIIFFVVCMHIPVNLPGVLGIMLLYFIYNFTELAYLQKTIQKPKG